MERLSMCVGNSEERKTFSVRKSLCVSVRERV